MALDLQIDILKFFIGLRTPFLNKVGEFFTIFGEEIIPLAIVLLVFWCINKKKGFASCLILVFCVTLTNFIKSIVRFPRPWVVETKLSTIRQETATGYSFPSGHSSCATSFYPSLAKGFKKTWLRIVSVILAVMVPISRMYLCCHWPMDIVGGTIVGLTCCFALYNTFENLCENKKFCQKYMSLIGAILFVIGMVMSVLLQLEMIEELAYSDFLKSLGLLSSMLLFYPIEQKHYGFTVDGTLVQKILRYIVGITGAMFFMVGVKKLLPYVPVISYLRYSAVAAWACLYPLLGRKIKLFN